MIATADDEVIVVIVTSGEADILVRICLVVDEAILDAVLRDADGDAICSVLFRLGDHAQLL